MINMAALKQAMEQMDADDIAVAHAARDRTAQILSDARLNFAKMAELIEERRLLLRPRIVASIKRMDQPDGLGDSAFRDTGASLRTEGQSFRQIAEALELGGEIAARQEKAAQSGLQAVAFESTRADSETPSAPAMVSYLLRFVVIAGLAVALVYALHEFAAGSWHFPGYRAGLGTARQRADVTPQVAPGEPAPSASPSAGPTPASAPPAATVAPSTNEPAPATPAPAASANPPAASPPPSTPSMPAANNRPRTAQSRTFNDFMPDRIRRKSRYAGPCMGGVGGCYWGGGQY